MGGWDQDDLVLIPMAPARRKVLGERALSGRLVNGMAIKIKMPELVSSAEKEIRELLRQRNRLRTSQENDFWIRNQTEALETRAESSRTMSLLLVGVGIFFGFYPARKASRLDPIDALRRE